MHNFATLFNKMEKLVRRLYFCALFILLTCVSWSQKGWEGGGWLGGIHYFGDLNTNYNLTDPGIAGGIIARYNFNERVSLRFGANYGTVQAYDSDSKNAYERARNLHFKSSVLDGTAQFEFNFLPYFHGNRDYFFTPYIFAGLSFAYYNPKAEYRDEWVELRGLGTEGQFKGEEYYSISGGLAYGLGVKLDLSFQWSINLELSARTLFTDYLDDVSTIYPDRSDLLRQRGEVAVALSNRSIVIPELSDATVGQPGQQRGNSNTNDHYVMLGIGLVYYFGDLRCPTYGK